MTTPHCMSHNQHFKSWMNWTTKFWLTSHIHVTSCQLTTTSSSISTTFCRENASTANRRQKMLSKSSSKPKHGFLCYRNKQTYFSLAKNVLILMISIFINKAMFEHCYNDLKFTVQNWNWVCTNLIECGYPYGTFCYLSQTPYSVAVLLFILHTLPDDLSHLSRWSYITYSLDIAPVWFCRP